MANIFTMRIAVLVLLATAPVVAQRYEPPPPPLTTAPCKPTKKDPCVDPVKTAPPSANPFPFPGEDTAQTSQTPDGKADIAPESPAAQSAAPGAFPFPGEKTPDMPGADPAASSSSSSNSTADSATRSPDEPSLKDEGSAGSTRFSRRKLAKVEDMGAREMKDVEVANYYLTTGNLQAAYQRAKDAIGIDTGDPAAHFALAQAAQRLNKPSEARTEYQAALQNDPTDKQIKEANRALAELSAKPR